MDENKYKDLDCHFTWDIIKEETSKLVWVSQIEYLDVDIQMNPDIELQALAYKSYLMHVIKNETEKALLLLNETVEKSKKITNTAHGKGYEYISLCNIAFMLKNTNKSKADEILKKIELLMPLPDGAKALVSGAKAYALHMGGKNRYAEALACYKQAYSLEKDHFGWPLGVAILAGRLRRILEGGTTQPTYLEIDCLKKSAELSTYKKALPLVFLADLLFARGRQFKEIGQEADPKMLENAKTMYMKAYELAPNSSHVLNRCGKAFSVLGEQDKAQRFLLEAVKLNPNNSGCNHRLGQFYEHTLRDFEQARIYYEKAVNVTIHQPNLYAQLDLIRVKRRLDNTFDIIRHLNNLKSEYEEEPDRVDRINVAIQKQKDYDEAQAIRQQERGRSDLRTNQRGRGNFRGRGRGNFSGRGNRGQQRHASNDSRLSAYNRPRDGSNDSRYGARLNLNFRAGNGLLGANPFQGPK